jgi:hypothetical protein
MNLLTLILISQIRCLKRLFKIIFAAGTMCKVTGWGSISENVRKQKFMDMLNAVDVPIRDIYQCKRNYYEHTKGGHINNIATHVYQDMNVCAGSEGKDSCIVSNCIIRGFQIKLSSTASLTSWEVLRP